MALPGRQSLFFRSEISELRAFEARANESKFYKNGESREASCTKNSRAPEGGRRRREALTRKAQSHRSLGSLPGESEPGREAGCISGSRRKYIVAARNSSGVTHHGNWVACQDSQRMSRTRPGRARKGPRDIHGSLSRRRRTGFGGNEW